MKRLLGLILCTGIFLAGVAAGYGYSGREKTPCLTATAFVEASAPCEGQIIFADADYMETGLSVGEAVILDCSTGEILRPQIEKNAPPAFTDPWTTSYSYRQHPTRECSGPEISVSPWYASTKSRCSRDTNYTPANSMGRALRMKQTAEG